MEKLQKCIELQPVPYWRNMKYRMMCYFWIKNFWKYLPYPLPKIGFMRATKDQPIRWYDFDKIKRRK